MADTLQDALRSLPSIDQLLQRESLSPIFEGHPRSRVVAALRDAVALARTRLRGGSAQGFDDADVARALKRLATPGLRRVINATGVVLHTNLGRAPLPARALARIAELGGGYTNLELDLATGERGSRYAPLVGHLRAITGAADALVVNNCAGAVLLVLAALAQGREAIVSRGELVEIGGGFRMPDVMKQSGVRLVEIGTTNRTRIDDYAAAIGVDAALLVKVHRSNFAQVGFTEEASLSELVALGRQRTLPVFYDLGSGALERLRGPGLTAEPSVREAVATGVDVVAFSGDKLFGGPQSGIILGQERWLDIIKAHPLNRALRVDKISVAALEATLELYRDGHMDEVPTARLLTQPLEVISARAERLQAALNASGIASRTVATVGQVGGGSMPLAEPPSIACAVEVSSADRTLERLRAGVPAIVARVEDGRILFDLRCVGDDDVDELARATAVVLEEEDSR